LIFLLTLKLLFGRWFRKDTNWNSWKPKSDLFTLFVEKLIIKMATYDPCWLPGNFTDQMFHLLSAAGPRFLKVNQEKPKEIK